jgi:hypothetical protein
MKKLNQLTSSNNLEKITLLSVAPVLISVGVGLVDGERWIAGLIFVVLGVGALIAREWLKLK